VGVAPQPVITMLQDGNRVWFADNAFRRTGRTDVDKEDYFLTYWDEKASRWKYYNGVESQVIRDVGVNHMLRVDGRLWLATMEGIALLHIRKGAWRWIGRKEGLTDPAIWDLEYHEGIVYAATTTGVERIDPKTLTVLVDTTEAYPHRQVLALYSDGESLFAGTVAGLYEYKTQRDTPWRHISGLAVDNIWSTGGELFVVAANLIYRRSDDQNDFELYNLTAPDGGKILELNGYGPYIWLATSKGAVVFDRRDQRRFIFNRKDGLPSDVIYSLVPTARWIWLLTKEGPVRFEWGNYFE